MIETITDLPSLFWGLLSLVVAVMAYAAWKKLRGGGSGGGTTQPKGRNILDVTRNLRATNAQWPTIMAALNPKNDPKITQLLVELRGPHMFAPHTALNIIEDACRSTLKARTRANVHDILRNACESMKKVTRYGD